MRPRVLSVPLLLAGCLAAASPAVAGGWSSPRPVTASGSSYAPSVALGPARGYAVAYVRDLGTSNRPELRQGRGDALAAPVLLDRTARRADATALAVDDGGRSIVLWRRHYDRNYRLWSAHVSPAGTVSESRLTGPGESAYDPFFVPGTTIASWARRTFASLRPSAGGTWGPAERLPAGAVFDVSIAARADGSLVAVWPANGEILTAERPAGGTGFGPAQVLSTAGGYGRAPQVVALPDGTAVAVWTANAGAGNRLMAAARPAGGAWGPPVEAVAASEGVFDPRAIAATSGTATVTYLQTGLARGFGSARGPLRMIRLGPAAQVLGPPATLTGDGERTSAAAMTRDASATWAIWGAGGRIHARRITAGGGVGILRTLSGGDTAESGAPAAAMATDGRAVLAYRTTAGRIRLVTKPAGL